MITLGSADPALLDDVAYVVAELVRVAAIDPAAILLVGAGCRDILHSSLGHRFAPTTTTDTDLGVAVEEWAAMERIERGFDRTGSNGIRYRIAGLPVDIVPFGGVEHADGLVRPASREEDLVVFGFRDVHRNALPLVLPGGLTIQIPHPAGYAALKMRSYLDRAPAGEDKDARDLALVAHWYQESEEVRNRLYDDEEWFEVLREVDFDVDLASVRLLADEVVTQLSSSRASQLATAWNSVDRDSLARSFALPPGARNDPLERRRAMVDQLVLPIRTPPPEERIESIRTED